MTAGSKRMESGEIVAVVNPARSGGRPGRVTTRSLNINPPANPDRLEYPTAPSTVPPRARPSGEGIPIRPKNGSIFSEGVLRTRAKTDQVGLARKLLTRIASATWVASFGRHGV